MLPQKYHASVSNMLATPLKYFMQNENQQISEAKSDPLQSAGSKASFYPISMMPQIFAKDSCILYQLKMQKLTIILRAII